MKATIKASVSVSDAGSNAFSSGPHWAAEMAASLALADGTGADQADLSYFAERTVTTGADDDIDLAGVLTDAFGNVITAAEVTTIFIINRQQDGTANTTDLTIDGTVANAFIGVLNAAGTLGPFKPGAVMMLHSGDAAGLGVVTAGTGDILRVTNSAGASNTFQIAIFARSA